MLNEKTIPRLQCGGVCGAANNELAEAIDENAGQSVAFTVDQPTGAGVGGDQPAAQRHGGGETMRGCPPPSPIS